MEVACDDPAAASALQENYEALSGDPRARADLCFRISVGPSSSGFYLRWDDGRLLLVADLGELVFHVEKAIIVAIQERRPDLLFLHAAALARDGAAWLFVGESGAGVHRRPGGCCTMASATSATSLPRSTSTGSRFCLIRTRSV